MLEAEMKIREHNQKNQIGDVADRNLDELGFWRKGNCNAFVQKTVHAEMAKDAVKAIEKTNPDVVLYFIKLEPLMPMDSLRAKRN